MSLGDRVAVLATALRIATAGIGHSTPADRVAARSGTLRALLDYGVEPNLAADVAEEMSATAADFADACALLHERTAAVLAAMDRVEGLAQDVAERITGEGRK